MQPGTQLFVRPSGPASASAWRMASLVVLMAPNAGVEGGEGGRPDSAAPSQAHRVPTGSDGPALSLDSLMTSFDEMCDGEHWRWRGIIDHATWLVHRRKFRHAYGNRFPCCTSFLSLAGAGPEGSFSEPSPGSLDPWAGLDNRMSPHQVALAEW